ncbi:MAG: 5-bromo-4-chloroindolyl phosphate hydrolysis family protein [Oscillospiraceae bacterium]|nr:5-bromo-4-chloroindolyl phosphate hydrolysis family protein [Oscillospiraceae bacterium]
MAAFLPIYKLWALLLTGAVSALVSYLFSAHAQKKDKAEAAKAEAETKQEVKAEPEVVKAETKSYGPEVDAILAEGNKALSEMGRLYMSIKDTEVRQKINEIMRITDKITQDAIEDPSDIPQIKKFLNYYLPTTIKLLNAYDRMSAQGIEGENLDKSMKSITDMLDTVIVAYKKRLDSLFANQALDIETDIEVMNTMLAREGLAGEKDFDVQTSQQ